MAWGTLRLGEDKAVKKFFTCSSVFWSVLGSSRWAADGVPVFGERRPGIYPSIQTCTDCRHPSLILRSLNLPEARTMYPFHLSYSKWPAWPLARCSPLLYGYMLLQRRENHVWYEWIWSDDLLWRVYRDVNGEGLNMELRMIK